MWRFFHQWGSPKPFYELSGRFLPWVGTLSVLVLAAGLGWGLLFAPADYQQGHSVRIMYIHVPAAIVAQSSYVLMALCALVSLIWRMKLADVAFTTLAPIGAVITALALVTGAIWGKPTWGTYWVWDARLTSTLILFLLFTGVVSLRKMGPDTVQGGKAAALLAVVGHASSTRKFFADRTTSNARRNVGASTGSVGWNLLLDELALAATHAGRGAKARVKVGLGARGPH